VTDQVSDPNNTEFRSMDSMYLSACML
jgi:hypothetical protein